MHGKISQIKHSGKGIFQGIKRELFATRYHSLIIDRKTLSKELIITAETKDKIIMGIMHNKYNVHGVQFHPESIRTPEGMKLLKNFLKY
jgi:anthranilate synthase component 2